MHQITGHPNAGTAHGHVGTTHHDASIDGISMLRPCPTDAPPMQCTTMLEGRSSHLFIDMGKGV